MFAVSLALLANVFRGKNRCIAFGVWGAVTALAVAIGPLIGGVLTSGLSWRWIFIAASRQAVRVSAGLICGLSSERWKPPPERGFRYSHGVCVVFRFGSVGWVWVERASWPAGGLTRWRES
jgi:MFS family permease